RKYLESLGVWDDKKEKALAEENKKTVDAAVKAYQETERDSVAAIFDYMYAELPDSLAEQREAALAAEADHGE
ncbi:MAG: pyruvate dehydrogenase (acetyl-transferring) E1 component subunit alpha, partial [Gammaproteobacteria bacterium]